MDDRKYQVFVSSTYEDLFQARKKIIETVLSLYHFPVGMEMFSADDAEQWDIIRETIDGSDYYVVIIGHKYGSVAPSGLSYTEMEYDYAKSLGIPVLAFIRDRNVGTKPHEREVEASKNQSLDKFVEKAKANKMCNFWDSIDDLATKVAIALPKIIMRTPRTGWVRGDKSISNEISEELAELSLENRKLREKVREFESQIQVDRPVLKLSMIDKEIIIKFIPYINKQEYLTEFKSEDIPNDLIGCITNDMMEKYNKQIPSNSEVDQYNSSFFKYSNYVSNALKFCPVLVNEGRRLATDVHISIQFPDFITILNNFNEGDYIVEPKIKIPEHPIEKGRQRQKLSGTIGAAYFDVLNNVSEYNDIFSSNSLLYGMKRVPSVSPHFNRNSNDWVRIEDNTVTLRANKLLQSLSIDFDSIVIVPNNTGSGEIKFKIICEELVEPIYFLRSITVN